MFGKKIVCHRCEKKVSSSYAYCPYCGSSLKEEKQKGEEGEEEGLFFGMPDFPRVNFRFPFGSLFRAIDRHFREFDRFFSERGKESRERKKGIGRLPFMRGGGISISISSVGGTPKINVRTFGDLKGRENELSRSLGRGVNIPVKPTVREIKPKTPKEIPETIAKKLTKLPKEEPTSTVRRLANKLLYEIDLPGVKSKSDVIVNRLQNSIEVKAFAGDKAYFKLIPLNLPLLRYDLKKGKLVLELGTK